jgi:hypothetical protein
MNRRQFLHSTLAAGAAAGLSSISFGKETAPTTKPASADAMILIWLPGGIAQTDTWDPKKHTPYTPGMKGSELLGTCPIIPTAADGISFGRGARAARVGDGSRRRAPLADQRDEVRRDPSQGAVLRDDRLPLPAGVKAPSMGAVVGRRWAARSAVPPYIEIGRDINSSNQEFLFINEYQGPGFYGRTLRAVHDPRPPQGHADAQRRRRMQPIVSIVASATSRRSTA